MKGKTFVSMAFLLSLSIVFFSCNKDNPVTSGGTGSGGISGNWQVDQVQMVSSPTGSTPSALMKTALVPFGLVNAYTVGVANVSFGSAKKWEKISFSSSYYLKKVQLINSQSGYILLSNGNSILKTIDGGSTWAGSGDFDAVEHYDMSFINENTGWISAGSGTGYNLYMTSNGGSNWSTKYSTSNYNLSLQKIYFSDSQTGWASYPFMATGLFIGKTTNGGSNWTQNYIKTSGLYSLPEYIKFINSSTGWVASKSMGINSVKLYLTTNGGDNWTEKTIMNMSVSGSIFILDANNIWVAGTDNSNKQVLARSIDGGNSWLSIQRDYSFNDMYFLDARNGYAVGNSGLILYTTNGGTNWTRHSANTNENIYGVNFSDVQTGCSLGSNGSIYKYSTSLDTAYWSINGYITNSAIQLITKSGSDSYDASGYYYLNNNNIVFTVTSYTNGIGNTQSGTGTYSLSDKLTINLNLANSEKWKIILTRNSTQF